MEAYLLALSISLTGAACQGGGGDQRKEEKKDDQKKDEQKKYVERNTVTGAVRDTLR
jgi:hypothetical protein